MITTYLSELKTCEKEYIENNTLKIGLIIFKYNGIYKYKIMFLWIIQCSGKLLVPLSEDKITKSKKINLNKSVNSSVAMAKADIVWQIRRLDA